MTVRMPWNMRKDTPSKSAPCRAVSSKDDGSGCGIWDCRSWRKVPVKAAPIWVKVCSSFMLRFLVVQVDRIERYHFAITSA